MQTNSENQKPKAVALLEASLKELTQQLIPSDLEIIAKKAKVTSRTVRRYTFAGESPRDFNTGKKILDIGREIVNKREQSLTSAA